MIAGAGRAATRVLKVVRRSVDFIAELLCCVVVAWCGVVLCIAGSEE